MPPPASPNDSASTSPRPPAAGKRPWPTFPASAPGDPMWFVLSGTGNSTGLQVTRLSNVLTAPTFTDFLVSVPTYTNPPAATQQGSGIPISTTDSRMLSVALRGSRLVAAHN